MSGETGETGSILALLDASRRRHAIAAEAFRATLAGLEGVHVQVEPVNADAERAGLRARPGATTLALTWSAPQLIGTIAGENLGELRDLVRSAVGGFVEECRLASAAAA